MSGKYLRNEDDSLIMRESGDYAKDEQTILQHSVSMFTTSMRGKPWTALNYIDLQAGPGKNRLSPSGEIILGSPLLALETKYKFDNYFFVEKNEKNFESLDKRLHTSPLYNRIRLYNEDCNVAISRIVDELDKIDQNKIRDEWDSLNLVFIDPEGLEINWKTIEILGTQTRSDLIINFSTSGITRNISQFYQSSRTTAIDRFFGTREWRQRYEDLPSREGTIIRRGLLDFYAERLNSLSYLATAPTGEYIVLNSKNRQLYSLICASKHDLGIKFWQEAVQKLNQPKLF